MGGLGDWGRTVLWLIAVLAGSMQEVSNEK